jgi:hypothetical protein
VFFNQDKDSKITAEPHSFPHRTEPLSQKLTRRVRQFMVEYVPLFEAMAVAVSAHILAFPLIWFIGWALPWPKSPEIVTVIEIDLTNWPNEAVPKSITDIYKSQMHGKK